jgi:hypothetical protein
MLCKSFSLNGNNPPPQKQGICPLCRWDLVKKPELWEGEVHLVRFRENDELVLIKVGTAVTSGIALISSVVTRKDQRRRLRFVSR